MIYFTSDLHLGHYNIIHMCKRPFKTLEEMNKTLIRNWNNTISPSDTVYILGDIAMKLTVQDINKIIYQLNGKKILIKGNHDKKYDESLFEEVCDYKEIKHNGYHFCLFHYPIEEWNGFFRGSIHLHGHQHNHSIYNKAMRAKNLRRYDVGVDANDFKPVSIEEIIKFISM